MTAWQDKIKSYKPGQVEIGNLSGARTVDGIEIRSLLDAPDAKIP